MFKTLRRLSKGSASDVPTNEIRSRVEWIEIAKTHVRLDKAIQKRIEGHRFDTKKTQVKINATDGLTVTLFYGSLALDLLWTVSVDIDSNGKVVKTHVDFSGF